MDCCICELACINTTICNTQTALAVQPSHTNIRPNTNYHKTKKEKPQFLFPYSKPGSNRHGHYCPQDFKSGVSTYSTIRATLTFQ